MDVNKFLNQTLPLVRTDSSNLYAFIIQFGSWDLDWYPFRDIITDYISTFARNIKEMYTERIHLYPHVKLLVMSAPSVPDITGRVVRRNNWALAVFARTLRRHMEAINIDFLDEFAFTFPLHTHCCGCPGKIDIHYARWNGTTRTCTGDVGQAFMALFTSRMCPHIHLLGKGGYVFGSVALSVCLFVCLWTTLNKKLKQTGMKLYGGVLGSTMKN